MKAGGERRHNDMATQAGMHGIKVEMMGLNVDIPEPSEFEEDRAMKLAQAAIDRKKAEWAKS